MNEYSARSTGHRLLWGVTAVLALGLGAATIPLLRHLRESPPPAPPPVRAAWNAPAGVTVGAGPDHPFGLALAPDGRRVVFPAARDGHIQLWLQDLSTGAVTAIPGTARAVLPFWAADGTQVGFFADGEMKAVRLADTSVAALAAVATPRGAAWNARGDIVFTAEDGGLSVVSAGGQREQSPAAVRAVTVVDRAAGETAHTFPVFTTGGTHVVAFVRAESAARQGLYLVSVADGTKTRLTGAAASGVPAGDQLLYANDGALVSQTLDTAERRLSGRATVLGVRVGQGPTGQLLATAAGDTLIFSEPIVTQQELAWWSRTGERLGTLGSPGDFWSLRIAPDGRRVAVTVLEPLLRTLDVVQFDGRGLLPSRLSLSIDADEWPAWSPDGLRVAWVQAGHAVMVRGAGAVLPAETLTRFDEAIRVTDWTPDGTAVVVSRTQPGSREDVWLVPVRNGEPRVVIATPFADVQATVSPDGRWIAYASDEAGQLDVYVEALQDRSPEPATRERVSSGGGSDPRWSRTGQELFFRRGSEIHVATPALGRGQNAVAATSMLFRTDLPVRSFDVAPDGHRFLLSVPRATPAPPATLILNWAQPPKVTTTGP